MKTEVGKGGGIPLLVAAIHQVRGNTVVDSSLGSNNVDLEDPDSLLFFADLNLNPLIFKDAKPDPDFRLSLKFIKLIIIHDDYYSNSNLNVLHPKKINLKKKIF